MDRRWILASHAAFKMTSFSLKGEETSNCPGSGVSVEPARERAASDGVGPCVFAAYWKHYHRISPSIAKAIQRDPELLDTVPRSIVEPWTNYMKLLLSRPDWTR